MPPNSDSADAIIADTADTAEGTVVLPAHLHARPAGTLAKVAARFDSEIEIAHESRTANPTGILAVMGLGAPAGATVTVRARGTDAHHAVTEITQLLATID
jgi:phosphotransferase system HPr (HPr) family protein